MLGLERLGATQVKTLAWLKYGEVPLGWCTHQTLLIFTNCDFITVVILLLLLLSKWGETLTSINTDILVLSSMSYLLLANANNRITESFLLCCSRINTTMETDIGPPQFHLRPCLGHHFSLWQYFVKPTRDCSMYIFSWHPWKMKRYESGCWLILDLLASCYWWEIAWCNCLDHRKSQLFIHFVPGNLAHTL